MKQIKGGVTAAKGFLAASTAAGIKYKDRQDMALIYSTTPCQGAGTFTRNIVKAAPVLWDRQLVETSPFLQAVVVNAGIANACTGEEGMGYCKATAEAAGALLHIPPEAVGVASTGVIGKQLPMDKIEAGVKVMVPLLKDDLESGTQAAKAIMTTDTVKKEIAVTFDVEGTPVVLGGMCKGSGMIHPDMCTMLSFVTTDCAITKEMLQKALSLDIQDTYNMISVDGDTSTNDTVLLLANGQANNPVIDQEGEGFEAFLAALHFVNEYLAKQMAGDGEGATALFEVKVVGAATKAQAVTISKSVITSSLTKAAIFGHDANWGRILCAMGYAGAPFDPDLVDLHFQSEAGEIAIMLQGKAVDFDEEKATAILSCPAVTACIHLHMGDASATAWGCDLTYDYIKINADYRS